MGEVRVQASSLSRVWPLPSGEELVAVDGAEFQVHAGEVFGLLGPNGAGKTTTLRMLATLTRPTSGTATVCGHDIRTDTHGVRRNLGYLSASSGLPKRLTCREVLTLFAELQEVEDPHRAVEDALDRNGVRDFADRRVDALSTGMGQRVRIACATVHRPPVVILDEPTAGLDVVAADALLQDVLRAKAEGAAVVFSTHVLREAERICDRIAIIHQGRIQANDTPQGLLALTGTKDLDEAFLALVRGG